MRWVASVEFDQEAELACKSQWRNKISLKILFLFENHLLFPAPTHSFARPTTDWLVVCLVNWECWLVESFAHTHYARFPACSFVNTLSLFVQSIELSRKKGELKIIIRLSLSHACSSHTHAPGNQKHSLETYEVRRRMIWENWIQRGGWVVVSNDKTLTFIKKFY